MGRRVVARFCELVTEDYCVTQNVSTIMRTPPTPKLAGTLRVRTPFETPPGSALDSLTLCLAQLLVRIGSGRWA